MSKKFSSDSPTFEEIKRLRQPARRTLTLYLNNDLKQQRRDLVKAINRAEDDNERTNEPSRVKELETELEALDEEIKSYGLDLVFEDLGRKRYDDLVALHRPTPDLLEKYDDVQFIEQNPDAEFYPPTFYPALIAAALVSPELTKEQVYELYDEFSSGDTTMMFTYALMAQTDVSSVNFSVRDTGVTPDFLSSLITQPPEGSPTASS